MQSFKIFKSDLKNHPQLNGQLTQLSESVQELVNAFVYSPFPWKLMAFINVLSQSGVKSETISKGRNKPSASAKAVE